MVLINLCRTIITVLGILILLAISKAAGVASWSFLLAAIPVIFFVFLLGDLSDQKLYEYFNRDG